MKVLRRIVGLLAVAGVASGCESLDGFDLDGGGGGGGGTAFSGGFAFIRDKGGRNVCVVDDEGDPNAPLQLTTQGNAYEPTVAPSGQSVAYVYRPSGGTAELRTVPTTGTGQPSTVFALPNSACAGCTNLRYPVFNPSSGLLVFTVYRGSTSSLARVNVDGSGFVLLRANSGVTVYGAPSFYPDGQTVLSAGGASASQLNSLVRTNITSGASDVISFNLGNEALGVVNRVAVSPDGARVAFDGQTSSGISAIFVGQLGQVLGGVTRLTRHTGDASASDFWPSWRGSTEVGFLSNVGGGSDIYRLSAATTGAGTLVVPGALEPSYGGR